MARLAVNIDHVATLREARKGIEPDPIFAAVLAELGGADGIIVHLREDKRHIQERDLKLLREIVKTKLNLEMAATQEMVKIALDIRPDIATIVPERRQELTTEGGLEVALNKDHLKAIILLLHDGGIKVSLFIDPDMDQIKAAHKISTDYIEIHTGRYANAKLQGDQDAEFEKIVNVCKITQKLGIGIAAGHGLNYQNVKRLAGLKEIEEFNIGHSIVSKAVLVGMERAVSEMKELVR
ncbi:MAG: pyridoxine 5'-phosphate synthase [Nitrospirae bacterium]|nr:pyridoxine 5'-phosphate synthase [Nitrospirota bacterium]